MTDAAPLISKYEELLASGRQPRPTLSEEERTRRRRASSRLSMEARRRATTVLIDKHRAEYLDLYTQEKSVLLDDDRYRFTD
jgi:hypothetical protein